MENTELKKVKEYLRNMTPEQKEAARQKTILELKEKFSKKKLKLTKWSAKNAPG